MTGKIGALTLLAIVFIVLKLCDVITWSWLWVLAPWWIPAVGLVGAFVLALIFRGVFGRDADR